MYEKNDFSITSHPSEASSENENLLIQLIKEYNGIIEKIAELNHLIAKIDKTIKKRNNLLIPDQEYEEILSLSKQFPEVSEKGEYKRKEILNKIEALLKAGVNPNMPEIVVKKPSSSQDNPKSLVSVKIYPLHMARDKDLITLLLTYGVDQNIRGYVAAADDRFPTDYISWHDDITALEAACLGFNYYKARIILLNPACAINIDRIELSLSILLSHINRPYNSYYKPYGFHQMVEIIVPESTYLSELEIIRLLSEKSSEKLLLKLLESELKHEKRAVAEINGISEEFRCRSKTFRWYNLIRQKIDIYTQCLSKKLSFPICLVLILGHLKKGNILNTLPSELLKMIFNFVRSDICEIAIATAKENIIKIDVFKKIYILLAKHDSRVESSQLPDITTERSPEEFLLLIEKELCTDGSSLIAKAWQLTLSHYDNFSSKNVLLVEALTLWSAKNNRNYGVLSATIYKMKMFNSFEDMHISSIKTEIISDLNALTTTNEVEKENYSLKSSN